MFAVNLWQYILEVSIFLVVVIYLWFSNLLIDDLSPASPVHIAMKVVALMSATLLNSFYLFGYQSFQRHATREGMLSALFRAFKQDYSD